MKLLALLLLACGGYTLPDGGMLPEPGSGCPCAEVGDRLVYEGTVLLECVPNPAFLCDRDAGCQTAVCFGERCCTWECPQRGCP